MFGYQRACVDILGIQTIQICATARTHMGCWCSQTNLACPKPKDLSRYIYSCFHMIYNFLWFYYDFMTVFLPSDFNKDLHHLLYNLYILVSGFNHILKNMSSSMGFGLIIPYMMESQQNHVPVPTHQIIYFNPCFWYSNTWHFQGVDPDYQGSVPSCVLEAVAAAFCSYPGAYRRGVKFCCCFKEHTSYITRINSIGRDSVQAWFLNFTKTYKKHHHLFVRGGTRKGFTTIWSLNIYGTALAFKTSNLVLLPLSLHLILG